MQTNIFTSSSWLRLGAMLEAYQKLQPKCETFPEQRDALQQIWTVLTQNSNANGVKDFCKLLEPEYQLMEGILNIKFDH